MKKIKLLTLSVLTALMFLSCGNNTTSGGETGGSGSGTEDTKVIQLSKDGKTVTIDYENTTDEEQKYFVFAGENLGYNFRGDFKVYEQDKKSPYEFGMIFDYIETEPDINTFSVWSDLVKLELNEKNKYKFTFGKISGLPRETYNLLNFSDEKLSDYFIADTGNLFFENNNNFDTTLCFLVKQYDNTIKITADASNYFKLFDKEDNPTKFGYYLIIPAGSTCHLKLTISDL